MEGVDYSISRPNLTQLWGAGIRFVCRYLAYLPNDKVLSRIELDQLHAQGFGVLLNWEQTTGGMLGGYNTGERHAEEALRQSVLLGAPDDVPIYFSCDFDALDADLPAVGRYLDACAAVLGRHRVGVYGGYRVIEKMVPVTAPWGWQTLAWSGGQVSGKAHLYQYKNEVMIAGADCDRDRSLKADIGLWYPEGTLSISQDDLNAIASAVWTHKLGQGTAGFVGQQAETAAAFDWKASLDAATTAAAAVTKLDDLLTAISNLAGVVQNLPVSGGLTDADRTAIQNLAETVTALNNRLASP